MSSGLKVMAQIMDFVFSVTLTFDLCFNFFVTRVTNLGVIWLDPHNFLVRSHGQLLSMTSLVRVLPASAYTSNMVPNI